MKLSDLKNLRNEEQATDTMESINLEDLLGSEQSGFWPGQPAFYGVDSRSLLISGEITEEIANAFIAQLQALEAEDSKQPVKVYINTVGGEVVNAFAIYDWMRCSPLPIIGIVYGNCSSAGLPIFLGTDFRVATPRAKFFYHEVVGGWSVSSVKELGEAADYYKWCQETMRSILRERAKINLKSWDKYFKDKTCFYFDTDFAMQMGIVHDKLKELDKKITLAKDSSQTAKPVSPPKPKPKLPVKKEETNGQ
jgi:ATP-dependent protease ClpP protease subunit